MAPLARHCCRIPASSKESTARQPPGRGSGERACKREGLSASSPGREVHSRASPYPAAGEGQAGPMAGWADNGVIKAGTGLSWGGSGGSGMPGFRFCETKRKRIPLKTPCTAFGNDTLVPCAWSRNASLCTVQERTPSSSRRRRACCPGEGRNPRKMGQVTRPPPPLGNHKQQRTPRAQKASSRNHLKRQTNDASNERPGRDCATPMRLLPSHAKRTTCGMTDARDSQCFDLRRGANGGR